MNSSLFILMLLSLSAFAQTRVRENVKQVAVVSQPVAEQVEMPAPAADSKKFERPAQKGPKK